MAYEDEVREPPSSMAEVRAAADALLDEAVMRAAKSVANRRVLHIATMTGLQLPEVVRLHFDRMVATARSEIYFEVLSDIEARNASKIKTITEGLKFT